MIENYLLVIGGSIVVLSILVIAGILAEKLGWE